ncbi:SAM-dependent methyltransferase [Actinoalloteichus hoggarensis]|uniref:Demethylrebeccamycin-D-glucose O-methyltransferase n=1 Tax=Actinoalloteichus hoggarensis TaxID=1470176 RepID=A0A221W0Q7_9PSEU|nr:class I SAM-dependent methyltransferase [Actinoalloteichus hoggarensis]ASO19332.1 Demethylrebeccamycin-D-glucose O-methyltransferase [Actinoalloteichus hoggarensis]MBB5920570.1 SAM-dependent methyltransferase [Actinoalloteichus hoggarensis]
MAFWSVRAGGVPSAEVLPSPNIWRWPKVYEVENQAQDREQVLFDALRESFDWTGRDVLDVGCGDGFHLPILARDARSVVGVEPHPPLVRRARRRVAGLDSVRVSAAGAQRLPLPDESVDLVHARTAYFFGPGCEPGLREAERVLRPGGAVAIIDLDATRHAYGSWMRADLPRYSPAEVEDFFAGEGFDCRRVDTWWRFDDRESLAAVLRIEFSGRVAARAIAQTPGLALPVGYRLHVRRRPAAVLLP